MIVGEGEKTEPNYFRALKKLEIVKSRFEIKVVRGSGSNALGVVEHAVKEMDEGDGFDETWCVLDVEDSSKRESLDSAIKLAKANNIHLCLSNPSIEVWFLAHFKYVSAAFDNCDKVIDELNKRGNWPTVQKAPYSKSADHFDKLIDKLPTALKNARDTREKAHKVVDSTADANSSTEMYKLVGYLLGQD